MRIEVVPYQPIWPELFRDIKVQLQDALSSVPIVAIEHVGSTSVLGLASKPILDIDVIFSRRTVAAATAALQRVGYDYKGEWGFRTDMRFAAMSSYQ